MTSVFPILSGVSNHINIQTEDRYSNNNYNPKKVLGSQKAGSNSTNNPPTFHEHSTAFKN